MISMLQKTLQAVFGRPSRHVLYDMSAKRELVKCKGPSSLTLENAETPDRCRNVQPILLETQCPYFRLPIYSSIANLSRILPPNL